MLVALKPLGFVLATGLHPLVSETASLVSECLRFRLAPNRLMSLMQELLSVSFFLSRGLVFQVHDIYFRTP
jgi:hypothetical protein